MVPTTTSGEPARTTVYLVLTRYGADADHVAAMRPSHHAYARGLRRAGHLLLGGPLADRSGALFLYHAESAAQVDAWIAADPFQLGGVFASVDVKAWLPVAADHTAFEQILAQLHKPVAEDDHAPPSEARTPS